MKFNPGIKFHLFILGFAPAAFSLVGLVAYFVQVQISDLQTNLLDRANFIGKQLANTSASAISTQDRQTLRILANAAVNEKDVLKIKVYNHSGTLLASASKPQPEEDSSDHQLNKMFRVTTEIFPSSNRSKSTKPSTEKTLGHIILSMSSDQIYARKIALFRNSFIALAVGLLITFFAANRIGRKISQPILGLTKTLKRLTKGDLAVRSTYKGVCELEDLHTGFNALAGALEKNQTLMEQKIYLATIRLQNTLRSLEEQNIKLKQARHHSDMQNRVKSQFLAHVSHEIRTPMNGIMGFTELLSKSDLTAEQLDKLQLIDSSAQNLLTIINDILDLSKLESGKFALNVVEFDLRSYLEDAVSLLCPQGLNINVILYMDPGFPKLIKGDPIRLQQVITNLLGNALKFTKQGRIVLRAKHLDIHGANFILMSVSDTGRGIAESDQKDMFSPFLQLSDFAVEHYEGTGLGLTISKNIVERMQGYIGVFSRPEKGSTFWIMLPIEHYQKPQPPSIDLTVGLIHQNRLARQALESQLTALGASVICYASADSFIQSADNRSTEENVVIYYLPVRSTANSAKQTLKRLNQHTQSPLVLAGNNLQRDLLKHCDPSETDSHLVIPCRSTFLLNTLQSRIRSNAEAIDDTVPKIEKQRNLRSRTFLVADDNEINRTLLKSQLLQTKAVVLEAKNGKESLELINSVAFDLIFLDLQMPVINGMEIMRYLNTNDNVNAETPVIAVTAHALPEQQHTVLEVGFSDCLIKPLLQGTLEDTLKRWIPDPTLNESLSIENWNSKTNDVIQRVLAKTSGDKSLAFDLMNKLFDEMPDQLESIEREINAEKAESAMQITHKLNGSASFCEVKSIQKFAAKLEYALSKNGDDYSTGNVRKNYEYLKQAVEDLMQEKEIILDELNDRTVSHDQSA